MLNFLQYYKNYLLFYYTRDQHLKIDLYLH